MNVIQNCHPSAKYSAGRWSGFSIFTAIAMLFAFAGSALAQNTTSSISGVVNASGTPISGATITAKETSRGNSSSATSRADGSYILVGLPSGDYQITASHESKRKDEFVRVQVGQALTLSLDVDVVVDQTIEEVIAYGQPLKLFEMNTSEIGTNISLDEIENLPQGQRNFLALATLAPGVLVARDPTRNTFSSGAANGSGDALRAGQVNVFIDGVSLKSNTQQGGVVGQDGSRGSPFSKLAVQEFKVLTNNFKAEYEQAGTAIITAVTKSGSNEFEGELFYDYTDDGYRSTAPSRFDDDGNVTERANPDFKRQQYGAALGGPIIEDKLHFYLGYEANKQDRNSLVRAGDGPPNGFNPANVPFDIAPLEGFVRTPFEQNLYFGKLNWQINDSHSLETAISYRDEVEIKGVGGTATLDFAEEQVNDTLSFNIKHVYHSDDGFLNEFTLDHLDSDFNPRPLNSEPALDYRDFIRVGGRDFFQRTVEKTTTLRNNVSFPDLSWHGNHYVKAGVKLARVKIDGISEPKPNGRFFFNSDPANGLTFAIPAEANIGVGKPGVSASNSQFGIFIQDDWTVNDRLTINAGIRWDIESNANNEDFVTPAAAVDALRRIEQFRNSHPDKLPGSKPFRADDYISTGNNRDPFKDAFAPRLGFSLNLDQEGSLVLHGGVGRFFDRSLFRNALEESNKNQFREFTYRFTDDGRDLNDGTSTIAWNPAFFSAQGLRDLAASSPVSGGGAELRLVQNNLKPPRTDQFSLGLRKQFEQWNTAISYAYQKGDDDIFYVKANQVTIINPAPQVGGEGQIVLPLEHDVLNLGEFGYGDAILSSNETKSRFHGIYLSLNKPFDLDSGWGLNINYTYSDAKGAPDGSFLLDASDLDPRLLPNSSDEKHRLVVSGSYLLPWDIRANGILTLASGQPFKINDFYNGGGPNNFYQGHIGEHPDTLGYKRFDLSINKAFELDSGQRVTTGLTVTNLFNWENYNSFHENIRIEAGPRSNFGKPNGVIGDDQRTMSLYVGVKF